MGDGDGVFDNKVKTHWFDLSAAEIGKESFESMFLLVQLHGRNGLGDLKVLVDSSLGIVSSSIRWNLRFFNGAKFGSWIFRGSANFLLFFNDIGVICTSRLSSEELGECKSDISSSSPPLQKPASLSELVALTFIKADNSDTDSTIWWAISIDDWKHESTIFFVLITTRALLSVHTLLFMG